MSGLPVQLLRKENGKFVLNGQLIEETIKENGALDCKLAIISISGAFRKGKSFLLGFFLRYLNYFYTDNNNDDSDLWLGNEETKLSGFEWRGGSSAHTSGIWMWSKIFKFHKQNGDTLGIIILDTQGTFDNVSTVHDNITIFSMSIMMSSVQIYNTFHNIQEDDLTNLQLFTEYGKLVSDETELQQFQKLLFLIRDWPFSYEHAYGLIGGREKLNKVLEIKPNQKDELKNIRKHLKSCFENIECFLMPAPGEAARTMLHFDGKIKDLNPEFIEQLKNLVPHVLSKKNIQRKKIHGNEITGRQFLQYIKKYHDVFSSGELPTATTILSATTETNCMHAVNEANEKYRDLMEEYTSPDSDYMELQSLIEAHERTCNMANQIYTKKTKLGPQLIRDTHRLTLNNNMQKRLMFYVGLNEGKKTGKLQQIIDNLTEQISKNTSRNESQSQTVNSLRNQLNEFSQANVEEKKKMLEEIRILKLEASKANERRCTIL